jgi:hypothetical protein
MSYEPINHWVEKAKMAAAHEPAETGGVQVIRRITNQNRGSIIMDIAEALRPWLMKMLQGVRDNDGLLLQPARVRALALNVAQSIVNDEEKIGA